MIIKYGFVGDRAVIYVPDNTQWEIITRSVNDKGYEDYGLYLIVDGKERILSEADSWCSGRNIPEYEIGALHEDVVDVVFKQMAGDSEVRGIDIEEIIAELLNATYEKRWKEMGYIEVDANGHW